jgi:hypothetical protein
MLKPRYISPFLNDADVELVSENMPSFYKAFYRGEAKIENIPTPIVDTLVENLTLTATTDDLDERLDVLHDFAAAGLTHITLGLHDNPADAIRLIGEQIIPALRPD